MKILLARINIEKNVIILKNDMLEEYEFNLNDCKPLPKWAEKELVKLHFLSQADGWMFFVRTKSDK